MDFTNKTPIQHLQTIVGATPDGWWGGESQSALLCSGLVLNLDYDILRDKLFKGAISTTQFEGLKRLVAALNQHNMDAINPLYAAYILATSYHETAHTMMPVSEYGKGRRRPYGQWYTNSHKQTYGYRNDRKHIYLKANYPHLYYGRGDVQLTWLDNYIKMGRKIGHDLASNPELAKRPDISAQVLITGMLDGDFTGKKLSDYIHYGLDFEFQGARRVVNGRDKAALIAGYAEIFLSAIRFESAVKEKAA